jgi:hypothetical protein
MLLKLPDRARIVGRALLTLRRETFFRPAMPATLPKSLGESLLRAANASFEKRRAFSFLACRGQVARRVQDVTRSSDLGHCATCRISQQSPNSDVGSGGVLTAVELSVMRDVAEYRAFLWRVVFTGPLRGPPGQVRPFPAVVFWRWRGGKRLHTFRRSSRFRSLCSRNDVTSSHG